MGGAGVGNQTSYSALTGQFSYSLTFTASGLSLYDLHTHWSSSRLSFFSEPGFVYQPAAPGTPAQYALQAHIVSFQWPTIGPLIIGSVIDAQYTFTDHGGQVSIIPGVSIAHRALDSITLNFGLAIGVQERPGGGLSYSVDPQPAASAWFTIPLP
jgi:hypothetical protein